MADNVGYTPGVGATVAADEIAGVLHQRVKISVGTDGSATDVSATNPMPITGTVAANTGLSQPLTNAELRATAVPVSGTFFQATQPVSAASLPLPTGAATEATLGNVLTTTAFNARTPALGQATMVNSQPVVIASNQSAVPISATSLPLPTGAATDALQTTGNTTLTAINSDIGDTTDAAATTDTGTFSIIAFIKRGMQNWTTLLGRIPALVSGRIPVDGSGVTQPISAAALPLPAGAASEATLLSLLTESDFNARIPALGPALRAASIPVALPTDQTPVPASLPDAALTTYTQAGAIAINTVLVTLDLLAYGGVAFQCTSMGTSGVVTPEWSIDGATWVTASINSQAGAVATTFNSAGLWNTVRQARYLRFRLSTGTTGGTTTIQFERYVTLPCYWQATQPVSGNISLNAGTTQIGDVAVFYRTTSAGAASGAHLVSGATTNATVAKASAGRLIGWNFANTNAAWRYVKLHNQATTPTAGSGVVRTIGIPPNNISQIHFEGGIAFSTGIAFTTVTGAADADTTAVGANDIVGDLYYA